MTTTPIHKVPNEILAQIFDTFASTNDIRCVILQTQRPSIFPPTSLSRITLVCKRWYNVITTTESLWSTLYLPDFVYDPGPLEAAFLFQQLKFAGESPLTLLSGWLRLCFRNPRPSKIPAGIEPPSLFAHLELYWARMTRIELNIQLPSNVIDIFSFPMPTLKHLRLILTGFCNDAPISLTFLDHNFPNLTHVRLSLQCNTAQLSLPWSQLKLFKIMSITSFSIADRVPHIFDPFTIVHRFHRIEELVIAFESFNNRPSLEWVTVTLPYLRSLSFRAMGTGYEMPPLAFFQHLDAPVLENLSLDAPENPERASFIRLHDILQQAHNHLSTLITLKLTLANDKMNHPRIIIKALRGLVNIETFTCYIFQDLSGIMQSMFSALAGSDSCGSHSRLFPRLKCLELEHAPVDALDALAKFVRDRVSRVDVIPEQRKHLQCVAITFSSAEGFPDEMISRTVKPPEYNDKITSLKIHFQGTFIQSDREKIDALVL